ncbi:MAG: glutamate--tRNA ligase [Candidatus Aminicenantes bacterium]|nr:MAG: glutamate--tRNA ligase [Candidatus Aminicenantes bacterium]
MVRVRFAPSPTGFLHIGAARTCFFNWLYARSHNGTFILRIEDTDVARSSAEMSEGIIQGLRWLGLDWDEGPVFQSQRLPLYRLKAKELVEKGLAYTCYCTPEEIQERTKKTEGAGDFWGYDRFCLELSEKQRLRFDSEGRAKAVRFLVPDGAIRYTDRIHGDISIDSKNIEDFVLLRGDGLPTYHLSVVVDDIDSQISLVLRGDDHISNTPKQILLYQAFGAKPPKFAHLALILGPDKKKLSKRHGGISVLEFRDHGYLPLAFLNFLAQMSWSPGEEKIYTLEELVGRFALNKVSKGSPVFDLYKLEWLNGRLISNLSALELSPLVRKEMQSANLWQETFAAEQKPWFDKMINLLKERSRTICAFPKAALPFLVDEITYDPAGVEKHLMDERLDTLLPLLAKDFQTLDEFSVLEIERTLRRRAEEEGVKAALLIHALRMLVVGEPVSPSIFDVMELAGKEKTLKRMNRLSDARKLAEKKGEEHE